MQPLGVYAQRQAVLGRLPNNCSVGKNNDRMGHLEIQLSRAGLLI